MNSPNPRKVNEQETEAIWRIVAPLVDKMRAKYPKELNIDGFEPALTQDICEIVLELAEKKIITL